MPKKPPTKLTPRFIDVLNYANEHNAYRTRKSTSIAYISHSIPVAGLIIEAGGSEDEAIAGLLDDVAEDCGGFAPTRRKRLEAIWRRASRSNLVLRRNSGSIFLPSSEFQITKRSSSVDIRHGWIRKPVGISQAPPRK